MARLVVTNVRTRFSLSSLVLAIKGLLIPSNMDNSSQIQVLLARLKEAERRAKLLKLEVKDIRTQITVLTESAQSILNPQSTVNGSSSLVLNSTASTSGLSSKRTIASESSGDAKRIKTNFPMENDYVVVYTDGACENNGKAMAKAGIGVWFSDDHPLNVSQPVEGRATNNTAEIQAATVALTILKNANVTKVKLYTDSQFLINCITKWMTTWKLKNWRLASGGPVKNREDLMKLDNVVPDFVDIKWEYVAAHKGHLGNERADQLAKAGASRYTA